MPINRIDEREIEKYADAGINPILQTYTKQSLTPQNTGADVLSNLNAAGLKEEPASIVPATVTKNTPAETGNESPINFANLIQQFKKLNPQFGEGFDYSTVGRISDDGSIQAPTSEFGGYTIKSIGTFDENSPYGLSGAYAPGKVGGYEATRSDTQENGKPLINTFKYDASGALTGRNVRVFEGSDSGIEFELDASNNIIGAKKFDYSEAWKESALPIANIALMAATAGLSGPLQTALTPTLGNLGAQVATQALFGAGRGAILGGLTGQDIGSSIAKGAVAGGASPLVGSLGELAGKGVGDLVGSFAPNTSFGDFLQDLSANAAKDIVKQVGGSAVGSLLTGRGFDLENAIASGALSGLTTTVFDQVKGNPAIKALPKELQGTAMAAISAKLRGRDPGPAALNALVGSVVNQIGRSGSTSTAQAGGDFETSSIWEGWDPTGGEGITFDPADQRVELPQSRGFEPDSSATEAVTDLFKPAAKTTIPQQKVDVTGTKIATGDQFLDELLQDVFAATKTQTKPADQSVVVQGKNLPKDTSAVTTAPPGTVTTTAPTQTVGVESTKLPSETVEVPGKRLPPEPSPSTEKKTEPPAASPAVAPKTTTRSFDLSGLLPLLQQPSQPSQQAGVLPLADVFYGKGAVKFGPGEGMMADPTDFQGRMAQAKEAMELALEGEGGENRAEDAYERLMALADERPADTVDELMKIIGRG